MENCSLKYLFCRIPGTFFLEWKCYTLCMYGMYRRVTAKIKPLIKYNRVASRQKWKTIRSKCWGQFRNMFDDELRRTLHCCINNLGFYSVVNINLMVWLLFLLCAGMRVAIIMNVYVDLIIRYTYTIWKCLN